MNQLEKDYQKIVQLSRKAKVLEGVQSLLGWDQETYMPKNGAPIRAEQLKTIAGLIHKERTSKSFSTALSKLLDLETGKIKHNNLKPTQKAALKRWHRDYVKNTALPAKFVEEYAALTSESQFVWEKARRENDFEFFLPKLEKMIELNKKKAEYLGYKEHPYDALLDTFEPDMTTKEVSKVFTPLKKTITTLLKKIMKAKQVDDTALTTNFSSDSQMRFGKKLLKVIDYDENAGRMDLSTHPFSSACHPSDSRITTRILQKMPLSMVRTILHECGHAFYEMGLPEDEYGTPLGESLSLGIHESQSRWWETRIGQSKAFWKLCLPMMKTHFKGKLDSMTLDKMWKAVNKVEPSMIRVEADEVTYALHVILRFELEVALIEGSLEAKDIPQAWNQKMKESLGIVPKDNREGCLQDIHWSMGAFGYFPTYALGNLYAAHFFEAFEKAFPQWEKEVEKGNFTFMHEWLTENIHQHGRRYTSLELLKKVNDKAFSSKAFEKYLTEKYTKIY